MENLSVPQKVTASLAENSKGQSTWNTMPALMIRKVALVQALREIMPEEFGGIYDVDEMPVDANKLPTEPVVVYSDTKVVEEVKNENEEQ